MYSVATFLQHRATSIDPVSYTHLDVYKRQVHIPSIMQETLGLRALQDPCIIRDNNFMNPWKSDTAQNLG